MLESIDEAVTMGASRKNCFPLPADITSEEQIADAVRIIDRTTPWLNGTVNSAALPQRRQFRWPLTEESSAFWRNILDTNLLGSWLVTISALPLMVRSSAVRVLFLSSEAGWANTAGFGQYNVSKAALNSLGSSLAEECVRQYPDADVQINIVVPGEARSEMNQGSETSPYTLASMALLLLSHPAGGPNGRFFHRDGRHLEFAYAAPYAVPL